VLVAVATSTPDSSVMTHSVKTLGRLHTPQQDERIQMRSDSSGHRQCLRCLAPSSCGLAGAECLAVPAALALAPAFVGVCPSAAVDD
jgi:hypothetical protein